MDPLTRYVATTCDTHPWPKFAVRKTLSTYESAGLFCARQRVRTFREAARHRWNTAFMAIRRIRVIPRTEAVPTCLRRFLRLGRIGVPRFSVGLGIRRPLEVESTPYRALCVDRIR